MRAFPFCSRPHEGSPRPGDTRAAAPGFNQPHSLDGLRNGLAGLDNGALLQAAEDAFEVFIITDQNLRHQQDLTGRQLAILVLPTTSWPKIQAHLAEVIAAVDELLPGELRELKF